MVVSVAVVFVVVAVENKTDGRSVSHNFPEAEEPGSVVVLEIIIEIKTLKLFVPYLEQEQGCMEDTELQTVVGIVEDDEGSAEEDEVLAAADQPVAVG